MLSNEQRRFLASARRGHLATADAEGRPNAVPVCFTVLDGEAVDSDAVDGESSGSVDDWTIATPIDEKPKGNVDDLRRVRDVRENPRVALVVDRWSEDWSELGWLQVRGTARLVDPGADGHGEAVDAFREKYYQYADHALEERPVLRIEPGSVVSWGQLE